MSGFTGVQPPSEIEMMAARLRAAGVEASLLPLEGEVPGYTAVVTADGELLVGAASMSLYDAVAPDMLTGQITTGSGPLVIDANFPEPVLQVICAAQPEARLLFAAATSVAKTARLVGCLARLDGIVLNRGEAAVLAGRGRWRTWLRACRADTARRAVLVSDGAGEGGPGEGR